VGTIVVVVLVVDEVLVVASVLVVGDVERVMGGPPAWRSASSSAADHQVKAPTPRRIPPTSTPRNLTVEVIGQPG
jgi:hypothetical protein